MVYLHPPGPRPRVARRDRTGIPLWFLTRSRASLAGLTAGWERVPPDRRHLPGWARAVRGIEINVEVSELGTVLQARYQLPEGLWAHHVLEATKRGEPPRRVEGLFRVGDERPPEASLLVAGTAFHVSLERAEGSDR
jgi:hypothetical protein